MKKKTSGSNQEQLNIENYEFEPIKGYPMLNWKGKRPFTSTHYFPAQLKESYGKPDSDGWSNRLYWGDNLQVMSHLLKDFRGKVDLIYIDPPFDSKADYKMKVTKKGKTITNDQHFFEEKQYTDIWLNDEFLQYIYMRFMLMRELLSEVGAIYVHCDHRVNAYFKIMLDEIFGPEHFRNMITWKRTSAHNDTNKYGANCDYLLFYTKTNEYIWNQQYQPYDEKYLERFKREDERGRWTDGPLTAKGLTGGGYEYTYKGVSGFWRCPLATMKKLDAENMLYFTSTGGIRIKRYLDDNKGVPLQVEWEELGEHLEPINAFWSDIFPVNSQAKERNGYPTQKPEALLSRIIKTSSNPGSIVLDVFSGSGTTLATAMKLGRKFIGSDINVGANQIATKRISKIIQEYSDKTEDGLSLYKSLNFYNVNNYDIFRNPVEAKELLLKILEITPILNSVYDGEKDGRFVKIMPVNRIASKSDVADLLSALDFKVFEKRSASNPNKPVERILLVCMGHEPELKAFLEKEIGYKVDIDVVDILRDKKDLQFKRESEAILKIKGDKLIIEKFYPMNLLQKFSMQKKAVSEWRELVDSVLIDWNYDGGVLEPKLIDVPEKNEFVKGEYSIPSGAGTIRVKITDLLSESIELEVERG